MSNDCAPQVHGPRWLTFAAAALAAGCASGPAFVAPEPPAAGMAAIYVYRDVGVFGADVRHDVWVGAKLVGKLINGGYRRVEVDPGVVRVSAAGCVPDSAVVRVGAGELGYVQLALVNKTVELGGRYYFDYGCRLAARSEAEALPVLRGLRRMD